MESMINYFGKIFKYTKRTSSAFTSIIQVISMVSLVMLLVIFKGYFFIFYFIFALFALCILVYLAIFIYFAIKDPSRLHREDHLENITALNGSHQIFIRNEDGIEVKQIRSETNVPNPLIYSGE